MLKTNNIERTIARITKQKHTSSPPLSRERPPEIANKLTLKTNICTIHERLVQVGLHKTRVQENTNELGVLRGYSGSIYAR